MGRPAEAYEPVSIIWHSALRPYAPMPGNAARGVFFAAAGSRRGAKCISCGMIHKMVPRPADVIQIWVFDTDDDQYTVMSCCEVCHTRVERKGICLDP